MGTLYEDLHTVTYSGFSIHNGTLLHSRSQYTTVKHSQQLLEHTYTSDPHGLGTLTPILAVRKLSNTRQDNPSSGYRSDCTPQQPLGIQSIINLPFTSPDDRMSSLERLSNHTEPISVEVPNTTNPVSMEMPVHCCQRNNAACLDCYPPITLRPSSIVAYLRNRNVILTKPLLEQR
jgi:hypothetical protein